MTSGRRATRRDLQAQQTRRDIVQAARRLLGGKGYARTSMAEIAREAGVAVQTVYSSVGPKKAFLRELNELIDEEAGVGGLVATLAATDHPRERLRLAAHVGRRVVERTGDIVSAVHAGAGTDPALAEVLAEGRTRHWEGMRSLAMWLADAGALRDGLAPEHAAQVIAVLLSNEVYFQLTRDMGKTFDEAENWVLTILETLVLAPGVLLPVQGSGPGP
ncbi:MAG: TetR/AcrR family transcriptional regulator [Thermoflexaceae bacterium]|nr:TetR/AcrR family transcriptional regulator [Thermoflexaceae bacterium]